MEILCKKCHTPVRAGAIIDHTIRAFYCPNCNTISREAIVKAG